MLDAHILHLISFALSDNTSLNSVLSIGSVSQEQADAIQQAAAIDVTGYEFVIDKSAVKHAFKQHGNSITEANRGQIAITTDDFIQIPAILATGEISYAGKNKIGRDVIDFEADLAYIYHCLMEIRTGRKQLAFATLYKRKPPTI